VQDHCDYEFKLSMKKESLACMLRVKYLDQGALAARASPTCIDGQDLIAKFKARMDLQGNRMTVEQQQLNVSVASS
jgi:hypothetical protein